MTNVGLKGRGFFFSAEKFNKKKKLADFIECYQLNTQHAENLVAIEDNLIQTVEQEIEQELGYIQPQFEKIL